MVLFGYELHEIVFKCFFRSIDFKSLARKAVVSADCVKRIKIPVIKTCIGFHMFVKKL